ncbi:IclR family transcriptional regulator domain-containing protein [Pseudorhodoplanes sp.]|uniref:IclR family transcriptional regulator domain-containing protein n=1 Tax=Pseudorhodoplanes sp. TaxID=1934341 RepID=UPI003D0DD473
MSRADNPPSWYSESLARGLLVIRAFDATAASLRPTDVARRTGLNRAAARRYMLTLKELGYLGSDEDRFYLQPKVLDLGYAFISSMQIDRLVQPFLNDLAARTRESSSFAVLDKSEILFVARCPSEKILQISVSIGGRLPAFATSLGHALLSGWPEPEFEQYLKSLRGAPFNKPASVVKDIRTSVEKARKQGWALVSNMLEGVAGIAAPVRGSGGRILGAINVASYGTGNAKALKEHLPLLLQTAGNLERALQSRGVSGPSQHLSLPGPTGRTAAL